MKNIVNNHGGLAMAKALEEAYKKGLTDYYMEPLVASCDGGLHK